jgi:hypothetical protein
MLQLNPAQGIEGKILRLHGNQMPLTGRIKPEPEPVATAVWIFSGQIQNQGTHWPISQACQHPQWLAYILSNADGSFLIGLPSGEYTLFAQYDSNLYLNAFAGPWSYQTVRVSEGHLTKFDLLNTEQAIF